MRGRMRRLGALVVACVVGCALSLVIALPLLGGARGTASTSIRAGSLPGGGICSFCVGGTITFGSLDTTAINSLFTTTGVTSANLETLILNLSATQIQSITIANLNLLNTTALTAAAPSLTSGQINGLSGSNLATAIQHLSTNQLGGITTTAISNLNAAQIQVLTAPTLNGLALSTLTSVATTITSAQVGGLSNTQLSGVLGSLTKDNFVGIVNGQFTGLGASAINSASPSNLALLTPVQVGGVGVDTIDSLDATHAHSLLSALNNCAAFGCSFAAGGVTGQLTPAPGICLACSTTANVPTGLVTGVTGAFTGSVTHAVFAPGTLGSAGTATIASSLKVGQSTLSPSLSVDKTALPGGTVISLIPGDLAKLNTVAPRNLKLLDALGVGWQAPGGSTPDATKPLQITVTDPNAKAGDTLYEVVHGALVAVPNAVGNGSWHASFSGDPGFVLAQAAETNPSPTPAPPTTSGGGTTQSSPISAPPRAGGGPVETPSADAELGLGALALLGGGVAAHRRRRSIG